jgi:dienelactone hydrolase
MASVHDQPISSSMTPAVAARLKLSASGLCSLGDELFWVEGRPELGGRKVVLRQRPLGEAELISPPGLSLASRVHEYGGGELTVTDHHGALLLGVGAHQSLVAFRAGDQEATELLAGVEGVARGDLNVGGGLCCFVEEDQAASPPWRRLGLMGLDGSAPVFLELGRDFYASPRLDETGRRLLFSCWDHPEMPWEASEVWLAELDGRLEVSDLVHLAGGPGEAAGRASFTPSGDVLLLLEREGFSRPQRLGADGRLVELGEPGVEYGGPLWVLGEEQLVEHQGRCFCVAQRGGIAELVELATGADRPIEPEAVAVSSLVPGGETLAWIGSTPWSLGAVGRVPLGEGTREVLELGPSSPLERSEVAVAEPVEAVGTDGRELHGLLFRPPAQRSSPEGAPPPPLVVTCHGGPTGQARAGFDPLVQLLCARGFVVLAANYAGSTGFGAVYRRRLEGAWGVADVADVVELAAWLGERGLVDPGRAAIRGQSAGGFTALLGATTGAFAGTVAWYAVADLLALAESTHDFEAHYTDALVGPLPEAAETYRERSPVSRAGEITGSVLLLQGSEDPVVPAAQAAAMAEAIAAAGGEVELISFEGEGHGFRRLETIEAAFSAELAFYERVLCRGEPPGAL